MKAAIVLAVLLFASLAYAVTLREARNEFIKFQRKYQKSYSHDELNDRFAIFKDNLDRAEVLQKLNPKAKFGVTQFSDLSVEEFGRFYLNKNLTNFIPKEEVKVKTEFTNTWTSDSYPRGPDPTNWDWFQQGVCTQVYNQGQCGSCWAFSATETLESYYALQGGPLTQLSMEQIVDCDTSDQGCNGGFPSSAYQYIQGAGGLDSYDDYPYTASNGNAGSCQFNSGETVATVSSYSSISGESGLYSQASSAGPVSVCVDASTWQYYQGGVLTSCTNNVDHCVQLTGYANYGSSNAYWIVRNSWGPSWGENGFIWLEIGQDLCAIGDYATIVAATGTSSTGSTGSTGSAAAATSGSTGSSSDSSGSTGSAAATSGSASGGSTGSTSGSTGSTGN